MLVRRIGVGIAAALLGFGPAAPSLAQVAADAQALPGAPQNRQSPPGGPTGAGAAPGVAAPNFWAGLFAPSRSNLLGDIGGWRTTLGNYGISLGLQETSEVLGNVTGGRRSGADYDDATEMSLGIDTAKAFGWAGGTFNISALQLHGRNFTSDNLLALNTASSIEAARATRLWEVWYQQSFLDGRIDVKIGQQAVDQEFMLDQYAGTLINSGFGWPTLPALDMYSGGPAFPLSALGVRLRLRPTDNLTVLAGVFDDNPGGGPFSANAQLLDVSGTRFSTNTGALWMAEGQYLWNQPPAAPLTPAQAPTGLPGIFKLGFWYDSGHYPDPAFDTLGLSLADPASNGIAPMHRGNFGLYASIDQLVWRPNAASPEGVGVFLRIVGTSAEDRNLIDLNPTAGLTWKAPFPGRDNDALGIGFGLARISGGARDLDRNIAFVTQSPAFPIQSSEAVLELGYQYQVAPWWLLQPDFQYFFNPGGGIPNPANPTKKVGDAAVFGLRTTIVF